MPELPINTIIIVVLCFIVLLAVAMLLLGVWNPFKSSTGQEVAKGNACQELVSMSCSQDASSIAVRDFDANGNGKPNEAGGINGEPWDPLYASGHNCGSGATSGDNLATLCLCYYNLYSNADCETKLCGCGTGGTGTGSGGSNPARGAGGFGGCPSDCKNDDSNCPSDCTNACDNDCPPPGPTG